MNNKKMVHFIRHASTGSLVSKADEHITKDAEIAMEELGAAFRKKLNGKPIKLAYGDLVRHKESVRAFVKGFGKNVWFIQTEDLNEKHYGTLYNDEPDEKTKRKIADATWTPEYEDRFVKTYGCETNKSVYDRLSNVFYDLQNSEPADVDDIVILSSGGAIAMLQFIAEGKIFDEILNLPSDEKMKKVLKHGQIVSVKLQPTKPKFDI